MVEKWDGIADTVPSVVERLQALKDLHEQGMSEDVSVWLIHESSAKKLLT